MSVLRGVLGIVSEGQIFELDDLYEKPSGCEIFYIRYIWGGTFANVLECLDLI